MTSKCLEDAHINEAHQRVRGRCFVPAEDRYDFTMLDKIVALLVKTRFQHRRWPLAPRPRSGWMARPHPEIIRTEQNGNSRHKPGVSTQLLPDLCTFREASCALAAHVGRTLHRHSAW